MENEKQSPRPYMVLYWGLVGLRFNVTFGPQYIMPEEIISADDLFSRVVSVCNLFCRTVVDPWAAIGGKIILTTHEAVDKLAEAGLFRHESTIITAHQLIQQNPATKQDIKVAESCGISTVNSSLTLIN